MGNPDFIKKQFQTLSHTLYCTVYTHMVWVNEIKSALWSAHGISKIKGPIKALLH